VREREKNRIVDSHKSQKDREINREINRERQRERQRERENRHR
jgi:hypothetical protein